MRTVSSLVIDRLLAPSGYREQDRQNGDSIMRMNRFTGLRATALAIVGLAATAVTAMAADVRAPRPAYPAYTKAPAYVAAIHNWTGFYIGAFGGGGWGAHDYAGAGLARIDSGGGLYGGTLGYNWQAGMFVLGVEGDFGGSTINGSTTIVPGLTHETNLNWLGSVRGRAGIAINDLLLYGTGGWAYGSVRDTSNNAGAIEQFTTTRSGWTVGGGAEYAFTPNWSMKAEYRYTDLGNTSNAAPLNGAAPYSVSNTFSTVTVGLNFKWGGPTVSRY